MTYSPFVNCMATAVSFMPFSLCISHWFEKGEHLRDREGMTSEWRFPEQINGCIRIMVGNLVNFMLIAPGSPYFQVKNFNSFKEAKWLFSLINY